MKKRRVKFITIRLLPEEAKVLSLFCRKIGTVLHWHFAEIDGFEHEDRTVDILFDILQTIKEAKDKENEQMLRT